MRRVGGIRVWAAAVVLAVAGAGRADCTPWCVVGSKGHLAQSFAGRLTKQTGLKPARQATGVLVFHLGADDFVKSLNLDLENLHPFGYYMVKRGNHVALVGKDGHASGFACSDFLKRFTGYRSFGGGPFGTVLPKIDDFDLPKEFTIREEPSVTSVCVAGDPVWDGAFARALRITCVSTHAMADMIDESLYAEHPEYFPEINGVRRNPKGQQWNPCLANPDLPKLFRAYATAYFQKHPQHIGLPMGVNDGGGDCCCAKCSELLRKHGNQYVEFYNMAAKILAQEFPGKLLAFIAYTSCARAPTDGYRMEPNILVEKTGHAGGLKAWRDAGVRHFGNYQYLYGLSDCRMAPGHYPFYIADYLRRHTREYAITTFWQEYYPDSVVFDACRQYVVDELLWNMDADVEALVTDYHEKMFGPAAKPMRRFFDVCEEAFRDNPERGESFFAEWMSPIQFNGYTFERLAAADAALAEAAAAAPEKAKAEHVEGLDDRPAAEPDEMSYARRVHLVSAMWKAVRPLMENWQVARRLKDVSDLDEAVKLIRRGYAAIEAAEAYQISEADEKDVFPKGKKGSFAHWKRQTSNRFAPRPPLELAADAAFARIGRALGPEKARAAFGAFKGDPKIGPLAETWLVTQKGGLENVARNGGFESLKPRHWTFDIFPNSVAKAAIDSSDAHSGTNAACIGEVRVSCCAYELVNLAPRTRHRVRVWVKRNDDNRRGALGEICIRLKSAKGAWLDQGSAITVPVPPESVGKWAEVSFFFTTPDVPDKVVTALPLLCAPVQKADSRIWFDDLSIEPVCRGVAAPKKSASPSARQKVEMELPEMEI